MTNKLSKKENKNDFILSAIDNLSPSKMFEDYDF